MFVLRDGCFPLFDIDDGDIGLVSSIQEQPRFFESMNQRGFHTCVFHGFDGLMLHHLLWRGVFEDTIQLMTMLRNLRLAQAF